MRNFDFKRYTPRPKKLLRASLSWSTKTTALTQEVLRVLMNCSKLLPWERVVENVNEMVPRCSTRGTARSSDMRLSTRPSRRIKQGIRLIRKESDRYIDPKSGGKGEREQEKVRKKNDWYKRGGNEAVIFVPVTPNSQLQRKCQKEIKRQGFKIKVVEKVGIAIKRLSRDLMRVNRDDVTEKTAWYVERMEKDRVIDRT